MHCGSTLILSTFCCLGYYAQMGRRTFWDSLYFLLQPNIYSRVRICLLYLKAYNFSSSTSSSEANLESLTHKDRTPARHVAQSYMISAGAALQRFPSTLLDSCLFQVTSSFPALIPQESRHAKTKSLALHSATQPYSSRTNKLPHKIVKPSSNLNPRTAIVPRPQLWLPSTKSRRQARRGRSLLSSRVVSQTPSTIWSPTFRI